MEIQSHILDKKGEPIAPSIWYYAVAYVPRKDGKTLMEELHPKFKPVETPYPRINQHKQAMASVDSSDEKEKEFITKLLTMSNLIHEVLAEKNVDEKKFVHTGRKHRERLAA